MNFSKLLESVLSRKESVQNKVDSSPIVLEAKAKAKEVVLEAKDSALKITSQAQEDLRRAKLNAVEFEKNLQIQRASLENRERDLQEKIRTVKQAKMAIEKKQEEVDALHASKRSELEKIAHLTQEEARKQILEAYERELGAEKSKRIKMMEEEIKSTAEERSKEILMDALRFGAVDYIPEYTTSRVKLPDDELKGRIIGKEGRNISKFEESTGVDLDLDSVPGEIVISSYDPVRREVAKISLERLIADGRIQPAKIEEIIEKTEKEIEKIVYREGDNLCHRVSAYNVPKDLVAVLGKFKYRFSYGQNMIEHTLEETRIGVSLAKELKADAEVVRLGCLFHDIGKVVSDEEGTHVELGVSLLRKYNISQKVIDCVAEHHEDKPFSSIESAIVGLADHISGARPGARSEDYESYVQRMKALEDAAKSFDGVAKAYAIAAGREVRVFVEPTRVDDVATAFLAREIAKKIELEQTYPGVVKVTVIRETRVFDTAK